MFGSNLAGRHGKGAAKDALDKFGAIYGQGEGLQGRSYAIPTKDKNLRPLPLSIIKSSIFRFQWFAEESAYTFRLTRIGCGEAGYTDTQVAPFFGDMPWNVLVPKEWLDILHP